MKLDKPLESAVMAWLAYEKRCIAVMFQRGPWHWNPDVLGLTAGRRCIEVEIKRSLSDFKADFRKGHIALRMNKVIDTEKYGPHNFYYAVDIKLEDKVKPFIPEWSGLLVLEDYKIRSSKIAPSLRKDKMSSRSCIKIVRCLANQIVACRRDYDNAVFSDSHKWWHYNSPDNMHFEI